MRILLLFVVAACTLPPPVTPALDPDPDAARDPINQLATPQLRAHAQTLLGELIAALPADARAHVDGTTLFFDAALGEVNAYATCGTQGPLVAVSDGLLRIAAHIAMSRATDELFGTTYKRAYFDHLSVHGAAPPPPGFYAPALHVEREKIVRQRELFDEQVAFILAHELAHHYLGHLGCRGERTPVTDGVPLFDQASELAADAAGVRNLLAAGARYAVPWTEDGALLVLGAFHARTNVSLKTIVFAFERTHPLPIARMPVVTTTADVWRVTSGLRP